MNLKRLFIVAFALLLGLTVAAVAETKWSTGSAPTLTALSTEVESDFSLFAMCPMPGIVELYVGANEQVGKGQGEAVRLRLESDGKSATLSGVSRNSYNSEMTGGTELVTRIETSNEVFRVLATGKPVKLSGSLSKPVTWNHAGMSGAVRKFLKECAPR